jgi:peptidoglycan hydrolase CwlO-like protein
MFRKILAWLRARHCPSLSNQGNVMSAIETLRGVIVRLTAAVDAETAYLRGQIAVRDEAVAALQAQLQAEQAAVAAAATAQAAADAEVGAAVDAVTAVAVAAEAAVPAPTPAAPAEPVVDLGVVSEVPGATAAAEAGTTRPAV